MKVVRGLAWSNPGSKCTFPLNLAPSPARSAYGHNLDKMEIKRLGQVALTVSDTARAKEFYVGILGLTHLFDAGPALTFVSAGNVRIMLGLPESTQKVGQNSCVYFLVEGLDNAYAEALGAGATGQDGPHLVAKMPDHELWMAFLNDPDGNLVGLMEERR